MVTSNLDKALTRSPENETSFVWRLFEKARKLPESVPQVIRDELSKLASDVNWSAEEAKKKPNPEAENLLIELKDRARNGLQKYTREWKTAELKNNKNYEKLLGHAKSFDDIRAGDILRMRSSGENIAKYLLTDEEWDEVSIESSNIEQYKNKKLLVNFGNNKSINASIGLGDILPYEAKKVEVTKPNWEIAIGVLWSDDSRKWRRERVGYYDESTGKYIAIYSGYKLSIIESGKVTSEDRAKLENIQQLHLNSLRIKEMMEVCIAKNGYKKATPEEIKNILTSDFPDESDHVLFEKVSQKISDRIIRGESVRESFKDGIGSREKFIGKFGWYLRDVIVQDFPNISAHMLINLFDKESNPRGAFDPSASNPSWAYGLGQMQSKAWIDSEKHANMDYDRSNPYDQIHAAAAYLDMIMIRNNCNLNDAIVYYHMGPYVKSEYIEKNDLLALGRYKNQNTQITNFMKEDSWRWYMDAARYYYTEEPTLLSTIDLSNIGTELSTQLWDFVMSTNLPDTWTASCGQAVGILLNRFGIEALPQSWRDGKNWDEILNPRVQSWQFKKIPIKHPDEAGPWAILVYNDWSELGSAMNKQYGHVEIKWSDGKYYSYYEWNRAWWSAANNVKDPEEYMRLTSFAGFAYYPISKEA